MPQNRKPRRPAARAAAAGDRLKGARSSVHADRLDRLDRLATRMDSAFRVPGTGIRLGWDAILGLIPGLGDAASAAPAAWIVVEAHRMGAPAGLKARMAANVGIDLVLGSIPILGDLLDVGLKSNRRNVALLRSHFGVPRPSETSARKPR